MKIVFFGTPYIATKILDYLLKNNVNISCVVSQPDRVNRKKILKPDIKKYLEKFYPNIVLLQPEKASNEDFIKKIEELEPDLIVVIAYGQILKQRLLEAAKLDAINIHPSRLPKYRGAAPMQHTLLNGDKITGVTIMQMVKKMDAGDIIYQNEFEIPKEMNFDSLQEKMIEISAPLLLDVIKTYENSPNKIVKKAQNEDKVTFAAKISKDDLLIDFNNSAEKIINQIRAFSTSPTARAKISIDDEENFLKIFSAKIVDENLKPKEIIIEKKRVIIGTSTNALEILEMQLNGKSKIKGYEFCNAQREKNIKLF